MKKQISLLLFLCSLITFSQNNEILVTYDVYYNTSSPRIKKAYLGIYNNNNSDFIELPEYKLLNSNKNEKDDFTINVDYFPKGVLKKININFDIQKLSSIETIVFNKEVYNVNEKIPNLDWEINYTETKKIGQYLCSKATVNFRGRKYIIWYTKKIPLRFGPWKLFGLPGLILEAYDETLMYRWVVKKIGQIDDKFKIIDSKVSHDNELTIEEFVIKKYGENSRVDNFHKKLKSKLPRGTTAKIKINNKRQNKELIFEWEEETKEN